MGVKSQLNKLKDNWLLIAIVIVLLVFVVGGGSIMNMSGSSKFSGSYNEMAYMPSMDSAYRGNSMPYAADEGFAPEEEVRKIVVTSTMGLLLKKGTYNSAENQLDAIITSSDAFVLSKNVRVNGEGAKSYTAGSYQIKVDTTKYDSVVTQLEKIGEVTSFNENERDITGSYTKTSIEIEVEKKRLDRYEEMYAQANKVEDQIELNDRIFDQERRIKYLEDSLATMDQKVEYSTINLNMNEEQPNFYRVAFVKFSELVKTIVTSLNAILYVIFFVAPWAFASGIILLIIRFFRRRREQV